MAESAESTAIAVTFSAAGVPPPHTLGQTTPKTTMSTLLPRDIRWMQRGWLSCNQILLTGGEGPVLIDTGHIAATEETVSLLQNTDVPLSSLHWIINTHAHIDHFGGNRCLREYTDAPLVCGPLTAQFFAENNRRAMWLDDASAALFPESKLPPVPANLVISPDDTVTMGNYTFRVIAVPGHAPDMIAFFQPDTRILIGSDAMMLADCGVMNVLVWPDAVERALETMTLLRSLRANLVLPGHGPIITDVDTNIDTVTSLLRSFQTRPDKLYRHLFARSIMFLLLAVQPITREDAMRWILQFSPTRPCADFLGMGEEPLISSFLDTFLQRGILTQQPDGRLVTTIDT